MTFAKILKAAQFIPLEPVKSQCPTCLFLDREDGTKCEAFPEGIPLRILLGEFDHTHYYAMMGSDDGGLRYTPLLDQ